MAAGEDILDGPAAPPSANGELIFAAPWEGRVFGMARQLCESGLYTWDEFRACLIASIEAWEGRAPEGTEYHYYECFLEALETLLVDRGVIDAGALTARFEAYRVRPHGHDHHH
jgi:nitrile hydratase accessory protein